MSLRRRCSIGLLAAAAVVECADAPVAARAGGAPTGHPGVVAHDRMVVGAAMHRCRYFRPNGCLFGRAAVTSDGHGRPLVAIDLEQSGGTCGAGIVWFFDVERLVGRTGLLPPGAQTGPPGVRAAGRRRFRVYYLVNRSRLTDCAHWGNGGTDPYVYRWNGSRMVLASGRPPHPPEVLAPGFKRLT